MSSVSDLEREVAATRERLHNTIGRIQDKLTVSGMVDEFIGQAGIPKMQNSHEFALGLLRRYPLPVMIAAAGLGYAIYRINKREAELKTLHLRGDETGGVTVVTTGHDRLYDPDAPARHPISDRGDVRRIEA